MQTSSQITSRESYGEMHPDTAIAGLNITSLPGFSPEQIQSLTNLIQITISQAFDRHFGPHQSSTPIQSITQSSTQSVTQKSSNSLAKKKRNLRTRNQKKKKAQAQVLQVTMVHVQEVDQNQEEEHSLSAWNKPSKHVVLKRSVQWMCTSLHAVIQSDRMTMVAGMMIDYGVNRIRRLGVG